MISFFLIFALCFITPVKPSGYSAANDQNGEQSIGTLHTLDGKSMPIDCKVTWSHDYQVGTITFPGKNTAITMHHTSETSHFYCNPSAWETLLALTQSSVDKKRYYVQVSDPEQPYTYLLLRVEKDY